MSSRFHNKYHRHNHHTTPLGDPKYPDASHDPIASPDSPFFGPFVMYGALSAFGTPPLSVPQLTEITNVIPGVFIAPNSVAIRAVGSIQATGSLSAASIEFTGNVINAYSEPLIANGDFLQISVNGTTRYIRLWNFY